MSSTPESKVKAAIHRLLKWQNAYAVNYIGGQYANNGTPDILACVNGVFVGIEAKAGRGKLTALQYKALEKIDKAGGLALVVNENELDYLAIAINSLQQHGTRMSNYTRFKPAGLDEKEPTDE